MGKHYKRLHAPLFLDLPHEKPGEITTACTPQKTGNADFLKKFKVFLAFPK
jgi:hypothetical protein